MATCAMTADGGHGLSAGRADVDLNSGWRFMRGDEIGWGTHPAKRAFYRPVRDLNPLNDLGIG